MSEFNHVPSTDEFKSHGLVNAGSQVNVGDEYYWKGAWKGATRIGPQLSGLVYRRPLKYERIDSSESVKPGDRYTSEGSWNDNHKSYVGMLQATKEEKIETLTKEMKDRGLCGVVIGYRNATKEAETATNKIQADLQSPRFKFKAEDISRLRSSENPEVTLAEGVSGTATLTVDLTGLQTTMDTRLNKLEATIADFTNKLDAKKDAKIDTKAMEELVKGLKSEMEKTRAESLEAAQKIGLKLDQKAGPQTLVLTDENGISLAKIETTESGKTRITGDLVRKKENMSLNFDKGNSAKESTLNLAFAAAKNAAQVQGATAISKQVIRLARTKLGDACPKILDHPMAVDMLNVLLPLALHYVASQWGDKLPAEFGPKIASYAEFAVEGATHEGINHLIATFMPIISDVVSIATQDPTKALETERQFEEAIKTTVKVAPVQAVASKKPKKKVKAASAGIVAEDVLQKPTAETVTLPANSAPAVQAQA